MYLYVAQQQVTQKYFLAEKSRFLTLIHKLMGPQNG